MTDAELRAHAKAVGLPDFSLASAGTLREGDKSPYVALLHRLLRVSIPHIEETYEYDELEGTTYKSATKSIVKSYQAGNYLLNDGVCGYKTWMALSGQEKLKMVYEAPSGTYHTQTNKNRCWAAATATLKGLPNEIQELPTRTYYLNPKGMLLNDNKDVPDNSKRFAKDMNLHVVTTGLSLSGVLYLMMMRGRLMMNSRNLQGDNSHLYVLLSARGDGTDLGTTVGIWDPYPGHNKQGAMMYYSYHWLKQQYKDVTYRVYCALV